MNSTIQILSTDELITRKDDLMKQIIRIDQEINSRIRKEKKLEFIKKQKSNEIIKQTTIEDKKEVEVVKPINSTVSTMKHVLNENKISYTNNLNKDELCNKLDLTKSCFILGKSSNEAIAKESALKLKEISYIHAEGYSSSALKHGPFALIVPNLPVFILDTDNEHTDKNSNACHEVKARKADVYLIGFNENNDLIIDYNKTYGGLLGNIYMQIMSYEIAIKQGYNPDYPRNLAKVVTVE
jgi:glucosamine--fructose-6-phosphate aminotransferase (isomerizing)